MIYFLLPKTYLFTYQYISVSKTENPPTPYISNSLSHYLSDIKERIHIHEKEWDTFKKYTNPYEYIHSIIPNKKRCISKHKPLSRSFFKMIEIVHTFKLDQRTTETICTNSNIVHHSGIPYFKSLPNMRFEMYKSRNTPIQTFHLAEGPGGFIEAISTLRNNSNDVYIGMTIQDKQDNYDIPAWKKSQHFLKEHPNVIIENGIDQTGDILSLDNFVYCREKYGSSMDLITADGGFDFSFDFNHQEISISKLLFAQIAFAVCMQKKDGCFVLKIFDCFMQHTIDLLYLLSSFYEKVYITKPQTSRFANSERYIVCKKFLFKSSTEFFPFFYEAFSQMLKTEKHIQRFLNLPLSNYFLTKLEEFNSIFGQQQIENIYYTISLIESKNKTEKIDALIKTNIQKSIQWCIKYDVPYNNLSITPISCFVNNNAYPTLYYP
jgi:23S rRNA U2552 (ribose-2'-O)-methylase RlmE/FtsJ